MLAPAQSYAFLAALGEGRPSGASRPLRPVGCMRGLGAAQTVEAQVDILQPEREG
jgi:hypothetical protein